MAVNFVFWPSHTDGNLTTCFREN